jgi:uncharacterized protein (DUF488 family)
MFDHNIYTIGYEGTNIERFIEAVREAGISLIVDVRDRAQSRKKGFSKTALSSTLRNENIEYIHMKSLGDPKLGRDAARAGNIPEFERIFGEVLKTKSALEAVGKLASLIGTKQVCLLCYEREAAQCHRSLIVQFMARYMNIQQIDIKIGEQVIDYATERQMPYPYQSAAA